MPRWDSPGRSGGDTGGDRPPRPQPPPQDGQGFRERAAGENTRREG